MVNHTRKSTELIEEVEEVIDAFMEALRDGEITAGEVTTILEEVHDVYRAAQERDATDRLTVTGIRCGIDSPSYRRQLREIELDRERMEDSRPWLCVIEGGKDRNDGPHAA